VNIWQIIRRLAPFVAPYKGLVIGSILLTLIGALAAQVNPIVLRYTVDTVERLLKEGVAAQESTSLLVFISAILFGKELLNIAVKYGQSMVGENLRVRLSSALSQHAIERILTYKYAFFATDDNATGKLQTRIDRGVESLTGFVQNIFIDLLPLFANALLALALMFTANVYVGLVASVVMPIYFFLSWRQALLLRGVRRGLRALREQKTNGLFNIIESIIVIKSFVREEYERDKQYELQQELVKSQLKQRKTNYAFDAMKTFIEQVGVTVIIILTAWLVLDGALAADGSAYAEAFDVTDVQKLWALPFPAVRRDMQGRELIRVRVYPHEQKTPEKRAAEPLDHADRMFDFRRHPQLPSRPNAKAAA